jgi:uncharacterized protein (TIGR02246 family)
VPRVQRDTSGDDATTAALWTLETRFWGAGDAVYREAFAPDGVVVVPGMMLGHAELVEMMADSAPWTDVVVHEQTVVPLGDDAVALTYRAVAERGDRDDVYEALITSVYRRDGTGTWWLTVHQQTPMPPG